MSSDFMNMKRVYNISWTLEKGLKFRVLPTFLRIFCPMDSSTWPVACNTRKKEKMKHVLDRFANFGTNCYFGGELPKDIFYLIKEGWIW